MKNLKLFAIVLCFAGISNVFGQSQNALEFDGTDDFVNCGDDASQNITGNITLEAWIYRTGNIFLYDRIIGRHWEESYSLSSGSGFNGIVFGMDPNANVNNLAQTNSQVVPLMEWMHVAGTWDGSTLKIYLNGELEVSKPYSNPSVTGSDFPTYIGKRFVVSSSESYFDGYIDEVRIWDVARTETQIRDYMHREIPNPELETNLVAYYQFNEGTGQTVEDKSANTNDGFLGLDGNVDVDDPTWISSTVPMPFYTVADGPWNDNATWAAGQTAPDLDWAVAEINDEVTVNSDETAKTVTINPSGALTVSDVKSSFTVTGDFTIKSDATGTGSLIDLGTFSAGSTTVERYYAEDEWHLISSPISNAQAGIYTGYFLQYYEEPTENWVEVIDPATPLNVMQGYSLWIPESTTLSVEYTGSPNTGNQSIGFTAVNQYGWNLFGNPYPSSVDWNAVIPVTDMNSSIYYLNAATGNYESYNGIVGASRYIPPMQGFWISATNTGTLAFDNTMRSHEGKDTYYKSEVENLAVLTASGNDFDDEFYFYFNEEATPSFDEKFDAYKLISNYNVLLPQLFSYAGSTMLSIDARPATEAVSLGFLSQTSGTYSISLKESNDFSSLVLEDLFTGSFTELTQNDYEFSYSTSDDNNRFILHFGFTNVDQNTAEKAHQIYSNGHHVYVNLEDENEAVITIFNIAGQKVTEEKIGGGMNSIHVNQSGNYIIHVVSEKAISTQKVFIK